MWYVVCGVVYVVLVVCSIKKVKDNRTRDEEKENEEKAADLARRRARGLVSKTDDSNTTSGGGAPKAAWDQGTEDVGAPADVVNMLTGGGDKPGIDDSDDVAPPMDD